MCPDVLYGSQGSQAAGSDGPAQPHWACGLQEEFVWGRGSLEPAAQGNTFQGRERWHTDKPLSLSKGFWIAKRIHLLINRDSAYCNMALIDNRPLTTLVNTIQGMKASVGLSSIFSELNHQITHNTKVAFIPYLIRFIWRGKMCSVQHFCLGARFGKLVHFHL